MLLYTIALDKDHGVIGSECSEGDIGPFNSGTESDLGSDRVSPSEESDDSSEELTALYPVISFQLSSPKSVSG